MQLQQVTFISDNSNTWIDFCYIMVVGFTWGFLTFSFIMDGRILSWLFWCFCIFWDLHTQDTLLLASSLSQCTTCWLECIWLDIMEFGNRTWMMICIRMCGRNCRCCTGLIRQGICFLIGDILFERLWEWPLLLCWSFL